MIRSTTRLAASALVGGALLAGTAAQAESFPRLVGGGENLGVEYGPGPARNIVGGARVAIVGTGENATTTVLEVQHLQDARRGLTPVLVGSGNNLSVAYVAG
ncbi:MAG TPA: hypothetical protein VGN83_19640 [Falsiroseomonas sp.]|nr:hypothetical protein [Falsiroseomonas sp.]